jgi:glycosyltransferase involved in cell wall biosynthesis
MPLFSVVVPTHNRVDRVQRALRSILAQTFLDYEVIVVDDGSSDGTPAFLAGVASERCRVFRNDPNRGVSASRNRGCAVAGGEFIVFLDDDDELRPYALAQLQARHLEHPELDFMWGGRRIHEKDGAGTLIDSYEQDWAEFVGPLRGSQVLPIVLQIATNSAFTIRRTVFEQLGGFDEQLRVSEDRDLFIRLARGGHPGGAIPRVLIDIDQHLSNSLSRSVGVTAVPGTDLRVIDKHREYLERAEHAEFLNSYLAEVYRGFLQAGDRSAALRMIGTLRRRRALNGRLLRMYVRHAPEFRILKKLLRYDDLRRLRRRPAV